jgi:hypothetical protein
VVDDFRGQYWALSRLSPVLGKATEAGKNQFASAARHCPEKLTANITSSIGNAVDCIVQAGNDAFKEATSTTPTHGIRELLKEAIDAFGQGLWSGKQKLQRVVDDFRAQYWALSRLSPLLGKATEAGKNQFASAARHCPEKLTSNISSRIGNAVDCIVQAGNDAFKPAGVTGTPPSTSTGTHSTPTTGTSSTPTPSGPGIKELLKEAVDLFATNFSRAKEKLRKLVDSFAGQAPKLYELRSILDAASGASASAFYMQARFCPEKVVSNSQGVGAAVRCLVDASDATFKKPSSGSAPPTSKKKKK